LSKASRKKKPVLLRVARQGQLRQGNHTLTTRRSPQQGSKELTREWPWSLVLLGRSGRAKAKRAEATRKQNLNQDEDDAYTQSRTHKTGRRVGEGRDVGLVSIENQQQNGKFPNASKVGTFADQGRTTGGKNRS